MKKIILLALFIFVATSIAFGQKKRTSKKPIVKKPSVSQPKPSKTDKWKKFSGDGFTVLMPAKVQQQPLSIYVSETGFTGKGINYSAIENETYFNIGVAPNGFTVAFPASIKTAEANAAIMLKEIPGPNGLCARYWKEGIKCRLDFIKSTQCDYTYLLEFHMFINNKAVGQVRGISTPSRTYQLSVVNLEKYELSTLEKFFNSFQVTIK